MWLPRDLPQSLQWPVLPLHQYVLKHFDPTRTDSALYLVVCVAYLVLIRHTSGSILLQTRLSGFDEETFHIAALEGSLIVPNNEDPIKDDHLMTTCH